MRDCLCVCLTKCLFLCFCFSLCVCLNKCLFLCFHLDFISILPLLFPLFPLFPRIRSSPSLSLLYRHIRKHLRRPPSRLKLLLFTLFILPYSRRSRLALLRKPTPILLVVLQGTLHTMRTWRQHLRSSRLRFHSQHQRPRTPNQMKPPSRAGFGDEKSAARTKQLCE